HRALLRLHSFPTRRSSDLAGLTLFGLLLWAGAGHMAVADQLGWRELLTQPAAWWVMGCILGLGVAGGFYIVPLYALIQARTDNRSEEHTSELQSRENLVCR